MASNSKNLAELLNGDVTVTATDIADGSVTSAKLDTNIALGGTITVADEEGLNVTTNNLPDIRPSIMCDFINSKEVDSRFRFDRTGSGTYYDGSKVKDVENLFPNTDDLSSSSFNGLFRTTVSDGESDRFGGTSAILVSGDGSSGAAAGVYRNFSFSNFGSTKFGLSVFAKANGSNYAWVGTNNQSDKAVTFDLSTASVITSATGYTGSMQNLNDGWWRLQVVYDRSVGIDSPYFMFGITDSAGSFSTRTTATSEKIYFFGPQIEVRDSVSGYLETTGADGVTRFVSHLRTATKDIPRIDHDPETLECKGLMIEETRTNSAINSNIADASKSIGSNSVYVGRTISPTGDNDAARVLYSPGGGVAYLKLNSVVTFSSTGTYTVSVWCRRVQGTGNGSEQFYLDQYSQGISVSGQLPSTLNVWTRVWGTVSIASTGTTTVTLPFYDNTNNTIIDYWGLQVEKGSFPTSYIPTGSSTATRYFDKLVVEGDSFSSWYEDGGTAYVHAETRPSMAYGSILSFREGLTGENANELYFPHGDGNDQIRYSNRSVGAFTRIVNVDSAEHFSSSDIDDGITAKIAFTTITDDIAFASKGITPTGTSGRVSSFDKLTFNANRLDSAGWNGWLKKFAFYPKRLTNAIMAKITED